MIRFGIDIDGTTTTQDALLPFINRDFGLNLTLEDIKEYDLHPAAKTTKDHFQQWFAEKEAEIYQLSPLMTGAKEILSEWYKQYELFFISARSTKVFDVTKKWFLNNKLPYHHLELVGSHDKIEAVQKHQIELFFEDKHDNAVAIAEHCHIPVLLFDSPYNRMSIPDNVIRITNWQEAKNWVEKWMNVYKN